MFNSVMAILPWPQPQATQMSASPKPQSRHIHVHHHITVGPWTILGALAGMHLMVYAALSCALIFNPQSMKAFLDAMRATPISVTYADGRNTGP